MVCIDQRMKKIYVETTKMAAQINAQYRTLTTDGEQKYDGKTAQAFSSKLQELNKPQNQ